jgi:hypothetical protein
MSGRQKLEKQRPFVGILLMPGSYGTFSKGSKTRAGLLYPLKA